MEKNAWLQWFHRNCNPRNYLQIGLDTGADLQFVLSNTPTVAIDGNPALEHELSENQQVFETSSNDFFENNSIEEIFGDKIELALVNNINDNYHALRDFINIELHSDKDTIVLLDGDIQKILHILKRYRPDLTLRTITTGLGFINNLDADSTVLENNFSSIFEELVNLPDEEVNPVDNVEDVIKCLE
jgi:hypothetical protein